MKKNGIRTLLLMILLVLAVVLGQVIGTSCAGMKTLSWLGACAKFGLSPVDLDLSVVKFTFGMTVSINVAQAILLLAAILAYIKIKVRE
ncbi:DUF4321 domain-containing protein [Caproiciproducens galactitolivorans]|uniref:DUF4321 domain-containing protein n=1 Tax=Caproiciproducens galactitolivorans TaxID=642589 RepID=A0ABT4BS96_9FIRM|nr:DUF4321 domain-containing protein [Caproiciproducens galactitolivorans]MCY1713714.1 DUF4321 domain-containing protein [Caproiciproducens galactitolivorans]